MRFSELMSSTMIITPSFFSSLLLSGAIVALTERSSSPARSEASIRVSDS